MPSKPGPLLHLFPLLLFCSHRHARHLHSFPTRALPIFIRRLYRPVDGRPPENPLEFRETAVHFRKRRAAEVERSEEHTSELQSHSDLVCRLLLEKKKPLWLTSPRSKSASAKPAPLTTP